MILTRLENMNFSWTATFVLIFTLLLVQGCSPAEKPVCEFKQGDIVRTVIGNQVGQVTYVYTACRRYSVRFSGHQIFTDTHLIDKDGPLNSRPFFTDTFKAFELQGGRN